MMTGCATPTIAPVFGTNDGVPNGAVPVNGVGSCPSAAPAAAGSATGGAHGGGGGASGSPCGGGGGGKPGNGGSSKGGGGAGGAATTPGSPGTGSGSANAGPVPSTNTAAIPAAFRAAKRLARVQPDICIPPSQLLDPVWHSGVTSYLIHAWCGTGQERN